MDRDEGFVSEGHGAAGRTAKEFIPSPSSAKPYSNGITADYRAFPDIPSDGVVTWREMAPALTLLLLLAFTFFSLPLFAQAPVAPSVAPLTLENSVQEALRRSPQVRAARAVLETARVQADRDKPVARPTVTAIASGTAQGPRVDFPRPDGQQAVVLPEAVGRLDLVLEQPLYRAGQKAARQRYAAQLSAADLDFRKAVSDVALAVLKAYIAGCCARMRASARRRTAWRPRSIPAVPSSARSRRASPSPVLEFADRSGAGSGGPIRAVAGGGRRRPGTVQFQPPPWARNAAACRGG